MSTLKQIAQDLNLSVSTVSRILNGKGKKARISDATVALVLKYANEVGYSPNMVAKGLQASQSFSIGLMLPDITNLFFAEMAKNIEKWASKSQYSVVLVNSDEDVEKEKKQLANLMGRKVDGIIAAPVGDSFAHFAKIVKQKIPLVFIDRYFPDLSVPFITSDNYQGSFEATQELTRKGHERICLISGNQSNELVKQRRAGYVDALHSAGIAVSEELILGNAFSIENGYASTKKALMNAHPPTAIFAMNNLIGFGVLQAVKELELKIPEAVSLIIFDNHPYLSLQNPSISTVKQDSEKIGEMAVKALLEAIQEETDIEALQIPTTLILRESISVLD
ncbi:LacI family transcriptional regulator [Marinilongibacter aquaticus]|uniref:LacI family DNA-binding transcriptional regulator n=1 Tax=Marinilongibacter aquaticus TaxID=2975157 RepID=UPI0021BD3054|nr:LacI family DNA-binding transcriptional regulator [Marinilongibacter aquaticus]UBM59788.1 LacI family transcriptional regulator [Marinilongibacter aquaticus]